jgi:hypothetical protein
MWVLQCGALPRTVQVETADPNRFCGTQASCLAASLVPVRAYNSSNVLDKLPAQV